MENFGNSRNFHGDIVSGNGTSGYQIRFDDLPSGLQNVYVKRRNIITVVDRGDEEKEYEDETEESLSSSSSSSTTTSQATHTKSPPSQQSFSSSYVNNNNYSEIIREIREIEKSQIALNKKINSFHKEFMVLIKVL